ncbi:MAG: hypothetical protein AAF805_15670, partial [Planctomycetota bacterium]
DPDTLAFLESVGVFVDESGNPIPPPVSPTPPAPVEPIDPADADAALARFFEQIGLTLDESGNPVPVEPTPPREPTPPAEPPTPEELSQLLGIPVELLVTPPEPPQPAMIEPAVIEPAAPIAATPPPIATPEDLDAFLAELGIPGVLTPGPPVEPTPPVEPLSEAELLVMLGVVQPQTRMISVAIPPGLAIPEPASVACGAIALALLAGGSRRRR